MLKSNNLFLKVIKLLREKNLTQTELARLSGITQPALSKILSGKYETKMITTKKLAKALNVPVSYLIDDSEKNFENSGIIGNNNIQTPSNKLDLLEEKIKKLEAQIEIINLKLERNKI